MGFFDTFKRVLGFGSEPEDDDYGHPTIDLPDSVPVQCVATPSADAQGHIVASPDMVHRIFDRVVEITNASLPEYIATSLNTETQKSYLYNALDTSIKEYLASLEAAAHEQCMALWQKERDDLKHETDNLKQRARDLEARRAEMKEQNLSAERQKRALSERVHDLEAKLQQLEAEREQLDLEKQSLLNKVKVAGVHEAEIEDLRQRVTELQSISPDQKLAQENDDLRKKLTELTETIANLNDAAEAANVKDAMSSVMLNDLQHRASESQKVTQVAQSTIESLNNEIALRDAKISDLNKEIEERDARIQEDEEALESVQEIVEQMDRFQDIKQKLEGRIRALKESLKEAERENETLRTTIKNNLYAHAQQEKALSDRIEQLQSSLPQ